MPVWEEHIKKQNEILDKMFDSDQEKIMNYLKEKDLLEKDENGNALVGDVLVEDVSILSFFLRRVRS